MSFLSRLFGLGGGAPKQEPPAPEQEHAGCTIRATPFENGGRWQICGVIVREVDGATKEHKFIRADACGALEDAIEMTFFKGRQIIDQNGGRLFD